MASSDQNSIFAGRARPVALVDLGWITQLCSVSALMPN
jgi:hypothetical protein